MSYSDYDCIGCTEKNYFMKGCPMHDGSDSEEEDEDDE